MGWADHAVASLANGERVTIRPRGHSMTGRVEDGQEVIIEPKPCDISVGDVVLCKVKGRQYLHLVKAVDRDRYLIGNNRGGTNGWIGYNGIYGKAII